MEQTKLPAVIDPVDVEKTEKETSAKIELAKSIVITDVDSCQGAEQFARDCRMMEKEIDNRFEPAKKATHAAHKAVTDLIASLKKHVQEARKIVEPKIGTFRAEETKRRAIEAEETRKKQEAEKLALAEQAEKAGMGALADRIINEDSAPVIPEAIEKSEGVTSRKVWKYRIVDATKIPPEYMVPDEKKIGSYVRSFKDTAKIPGVEVWAEDAPIYR